jgi:FixJ family two-component response regulator
MLAYSHAQNRQGATRQKELPMPELAPIVYLVDDDISVRESLEALIALAGHRICSFASALDFLAHARPLQPGCLILDVSLPDLNGLDLQERVGEEQSELPIIFITGHGDIPMSVRAMKAGATEFLTKPIDNAALMAAIVAALEQSRLAFAARSDLKALRSDYALLSKRESEVMTLVVRGLLNKQVGGELGISEITVKAHRGQVMRKMKAHSFAELVNMGVRLGLTEQPNP